MACASPTAQAATATTSNAMRAEMALTLQVRSFAVEGVRSCYDWLKSEAVGTAAVTAPQVRTV